MADLVGNPEDRFSHNEAQIKGNSLMKFVCLHVCYKQMLYKTVQNTAKSDDTTIVKGLSNIKPFRIKIILKRISLKDEK